MITIKGLLTSLLLTSVFFAVMLALVVNHLALDWR